MGKIKEGPHGDLMTKEGDQNVMDGARKGRIPACSKMCLKSNQREDHNDPA